MRPTGQNDNANAVSRALLTLFPSLECRQIPAPMVADPASTPFHELSPEFQAAMEESMRFILGKIKPRKAVNSGVELDGFLLAELACNYTKGLKEPTSVPNLEDSYMCAIKCKLNCISNELAQLYKEEMQRELQPCNCPLEEGCFEVSRSSSGRSVTLFGIHNNIYSSKLQSLKKDLQTYMASSSYDAEREIILNSFVSQIYQVADHKIQGGLLYVFVTENEKRSYAHCIKVFDQVYGACHDEVNLKEIKAAYQKHAIGPAKSLVLQEKVSAIPLAPSNFTEHEGGVRSILVTWDRSKIDPQLQDVITYEVDIKMLNQKPQHTRRDVFPRGTTPPQIVTNLSPNTKYTFRIRACSCSYKGEFSPALSVKTLSGIPDKPDKPTVKLQDPSKALLSIQPLSKEKLNGALYIDKVIIEHSYCDDDERWDKISIDITKSKNKVINIPIDLPQIPSDCRCLYYRIRVVTIGGTSEASDPERLYAPELIPGPPTNIQCASDPEKREAVLSWNTPTTNSQSAALYRIQVLQEDGVVNDTKITPEKKVVLSCLKPATKYHIHLTAYNDKNTGITAEHILQTRAAKPAKPRKPRIQIDRENILKATLVIERWSEDEENGSPIRAIIVESAKGEIENWTSKQHCITEGDRNIILNVALNNVTDTRTMYFRVIMKNDAGESEPSHYCELYCYQMIPGEPHNVRADRVTNNSVTLKWDEPQVNPKSVDYYHVQMSEGSTDEWRDQSSMKVLKEKSFTVSNLSHNSPYKFRVLAYNKDSEAVQKMVNNSTLACTQPCPPKKPDYSRVTLSIIDCTNATVSLPRPSVEESGSDVISILCEKLSENGEIIPHLTEETNCRNQVGNIIKQTIKIDDQTHYLRIGLRNECGLSEFSEYVCVSASDIKPGPPEVHEVQKDHVTHNSLILKWSAPKKQARAAKQFIVEMNDSEDETRWKRAEYIHTVESFQHKAYIKHLIPVTQYYFRVFALNGELKSPKSKVVRTKTIAGRPEKPECPTVSQHIESPDKATLVVPRLDRIKENGSPVTKLVVETCYENSNWITHDEKELQLHHEQNGALENILMEIKLPNIDIQRRLLFFRVKMVNGENKESEASEKCTLETLNLSPGSIMELQAEDISAHSMTLVWRAPDVHPAIVVNYIVECKQSEPEGWKEVSRSTPDQLSCKLRGLQCCTKYKYNVFACSKSRSPSQNITVETLDILPSEPQNLQVDRIWKDAIKVRWSKPHGDHETNDAYKVVLKKVKSDSSRSESTTYYTRGHSKLFKELETYTEYQVEVAGVSKSMRLSESKIINVTTKMSDFARYSLTAVGSLALGIGGVATYHATKPDEEEYLLESDEECGNQYRMEFERRNPPVQQQECEND